MIRLITKMRRVPPESISNAAPAQACVAATPESHSASLFQALLKLLRSIIAADRHLSGDSGPQTFVDHDHIAITTASFNPIDHVAITPVCGADIKLDLESDSASSAGRTPAAVFARNLIDRLRVDRLRVLLRTRYFVSQPKRYRIYGEAISI
jgi:hypothetical protein